MKRVRDYAAEERRRNEIARELGFPTRAQLRSARKRGETASGAAAKAREKRVRGIKENNDEPDFQYADRYTGQLLTQRQIGLMRRRSREWSRAHSRGPNSKYRPHMTDREVETYFHLFVNQNSPLENDFQKVIGFASVDGPLDRLVDDWFMDVLGMTADTVERFKYYGD